MKEKEIKRCGWSTEDKDGLYIRYHDEEWGVPVHDDSRLFEFLVLEGAQAGLSWLTVLRKRENYREAFDKFDPEIVANYDSQKKSQLVKNSGIIRNRLKIDSAIQNAKCLLKVKDEFGSFDKYIWSFVPNSLPRKNHWRSLSQIPSRTKESDLLSLDLKKRGFTFVGSTICYAHMQATGMINDHIVSCFRHNQL
jgi:DNA-3-methyladenine glycosylase I